ncbi:MAG: hypothetical protein PWP27_2435 [Clostridiales bacterium]|nr:hypothetical protein [Clostridiales bacterium]
MKKDKVKTLILILLVANSIFLTTQIWMDKKLWSADYNFFAKWGENSIVQAITKKLSWVVRNGEAGASFVNQTYYPQKVVVNYGNFRAAYVNGDELYTQSLDEFSRALKALLREDQVVRYQKIEAEDAWLNILKLKSIYIDLKVPYKTKFIGQFLGIKNTPLSNYIKEIKEFILVPGDSASNDVTFYIKDFNDGSVAKFDVTYDRTQLMNLLNREIPASTVDHKFSFELEFDKKKANKIVLDSQVLLPFNKQKAEVIKSTNPIQDDHNVKNILRAFKYSTNNPRKYIETDNTLVYIENYSTLKIHPDGLIEYDAIEEGKGLRLYSDSYGNDPATPSFQESLNMAVKLINKIQDTTGKLHLSSVAEDPDKPGSYKFVFNYYHNGLPITMNLISDDKDILSLKYAVKVEVVNGTLKSYRHYVRDYESIKPITVDMPVPNVLDAIYKIANANAPYINVKDLHLSYEEDGQEEILQPQWHVRLKGVDNLLMIPVDKK